MLQLLFDLTFKGTILLLAATTISFALRKSSAAARHRLWGLTMVSLLGLPLLPLLMPTIWSLTVPANVAAYAPSAVAPAASVTSVPEDRISLVPSVSPASSGDDILIESSDAREVGPAVSSEPNADPRRSWRIDRAELVDVLPLVWVSGVMLLLMNLAVGTRRVARFNAAARPVTDPTLQPVVDVLRQRLGLKRPVELREHPGQFVPLTLGVFRPVVVLPRQARDWTDRLKRMVLLHELAHVRRRDVAYQWLGRLACALYWFHPLAWWGLRKLRQEREQACDDLVIHCGERATEYAEDLVSVAKHFQRQRGLACAVAMARPGNLEGRMRSMFDTDVVRSHAPLGRVVACVLLIAMGFVSGAVAAVQLAAEPQKPNGQGPASRERVAPRSQATASNGEGFFAELADQVGTLLDSFGEYRAAGPLEESVKVIDEEGNPVAGAKVIPWGFGTSNGTGWGWVEGWPKEFITDTEGLATILVPEEHTVVIPAQSGAFMSISFRVEHPDYAPAVRSSFPREKERHIILKKGVIIVPRAINAETNHLITSDLFANSSGYPNPKWTFDAGQLRSTRMDPMDPEVGQFFRVIHAPADPPGSLLLFSDVVDAATLDVKDGVANIDVPLHPAVSLSGELSADVPLPLKKGGQVIASIVSGSDHQSYVWQDVVPISNVGTFSFPALPRNSHVELIAVCPGWVSKASAETLMAYDQFHQTAFSKLANYMVSSTPVRLETTPITITLHMVPTGSCEFRVEDEEGNPVDLATVQCMPNHATRMGSTLLGAGGRTIDWLRNPAARSEFRFQTGFERYARVTNEQGVTLISDLPAGSQMVQVDFPGYSIVPDPRYGGAISMAVAEVMEGTKTQTTLKLRKDEISGNAVRPSPVDADGFRQFMVRIVDAEGVTLPDAKVNLLGQTITSPGERQPWPADWPLDVTLNEFGMAVGRVRLPLTMRPEDAARFSIWFDVEHPGYVPLKNYEYSLTSGLPIRIQAIKD